jgi:PAS domain S-box-containing protein
MSQFEDFEAMVGNANIGVHCVNKDGYVIYANAQELETLGYERDEYIGHHVSEFEVVPGSLDELLKVLNSASVIENYPYQVKGKTGVKNIVFNSSIFRKDGEFIHTRCFGNEVEPAVFEVFKQLKDK